MKKLSESVKRTLVKCLEVIGEGTNEKLQKEIQGLIDSQDDYSFIFKMSDEYVSIEAFSYVNLRRRIVSGLLDFSKNVIDYYSKIGGELVIIRLDYIIGEIARANKLEEIDREILRAYHYLLNSDFREYFNVADHILNILSRQKIPLEEIYAVIKLAPVAERETLASYRSEPSMSHRNNIELLKFMKDDSELSVRRIATSTLADLDIHNEEKIKDALEVIEKNAGI